MPSHYLNQCWVIVSWTLRNKLQWNINRIQNFSFTKIHRKILSAKWQPFCPGGDELISHHARALLFTYKHVHFIWFYQSCYDSDCLKYIKLGKYPLKSLFPEINELIRIRLLTSPFIGEDLGQYDPEQYKGPENNFPTCSTSTADGLLPTCDVHCLIQIGWLTKVMTV